MEFNPSNQQLRKWGPSCLITVEVEKNIMQMAITFMAVVAGMIFSLAVALLAEELIFGQMFRLFFGSGKLARQTAAVKQGQKD